MSLKHSKAHHKSLRPIKDSSYIQQHQFGWSIDLPPNAYGMSNFSAICFPLRISIKGFWQTSHSSSAEIQSNCCFYCLVPSFNCTFIHLLLFSIMFKKKKDPYFKINVFKFNLPITFKLNMHFLHFVHSIKKVSVQNCHHFQYYSLSKIMKT